MGIEVNPLENEADQILADSVNSFYEEEAKDEEQVVEATVEDPKEVTEEVEETETTEESSEDEVGDEATEEVVDDKEIDEGEIDTNTENLRGVFSNEYIDVLESIDDPNIKSRLIKEGKKNRSELDRKRLELGEGKKKLEEERALYANYKGFDELYQKDPKEAIKSLAKHSSIDLNTLVETKPVQQDDDDYRLPEEIERDNKLKTLEQELSQLKNQRQQQEQISAQQEVNDFANAKDTDGNLKYPHFDKVRKTMGIFFNNDNPDMTMEKAYNKAILLDDELVTLRDAELLKKAEIKRKTEIEKAKKLKRQSVRSSKVSATISNPDAALERIVGDFFG